MSERVDEAVYAMDDFELVKVLGEVLKNPDYQESEYTGMYRNIIKKYLEWGNLTSGQRNAAQTHLKYNSRLWF